MFISLGLGYSVLHVLDSQVKFLGGKYCLGNPNYRKTVRDKFLGLVRMTFGLVRVYTQRVNLEIVYLFIYLFWAPSMSKGLARLSCLPLLKAFTTGKLNPSKDFQYYLKYPNSVS